MNTTPESPALLAAALARLPHGPEFRFLDALTALEPGVSGAGEYRVRGSEPFLRGHFPGAPLFPGVLMVEAAAQLAGVVVQADPRHAPLADLRLTAVRSIKILDAAVPGETLRLTARITARLAGLAQAEVEVHAGQRLLLKGELTLAGRDPATPGLFPLKEQARAGTRPEFGPENPAC